jgi:hypothetical protein
LEKSGDEEPKHATLRKVELDICMVLPISSCFADNILELNQSFIEKYKNKLTISVHYTVDAAHKRPNPASKDGEMHVAGRAPEIGLATVAELQNAKDVPDAVSAVKSAEGTGRAITLSGVWRIWPEHGGDSTHIQQSDAGAPYEGQGPTNPPHVFEIHPVLKIGDQDLMNTLRPVEGFDAKESEEAFPRYEGGSFEITPSEGRVRMRMRMMGFNYVKFLMQVRKRFQRKRTVNSFLPRSIPAKKSCWSTTAASDSLQAQHRMKSRRL